MILDAWMAWAELSGSESAASSYLGQALLLKACFDTTGTNPKDVQHHNLCITVVYIHDSFCTVDTEDSSKSIPEIRIHPLLFEFFAIATSCELRGSTTLHDSPSSCSSGNSMPISLAPLPVQGYSSIVAAAASSSSSMMNQTTTTTPCWCARVVSKIFDLPENSRLTLQVLPSGNASDIEPMADDTDAFKRMMQNCLITEGGVLLVAGHVILVQDISRDDDGDVCKTDGVVVYRVGDAGTYTAEIVPRWSNHDVENHKVVDVPTIPCPGYESQVESLRQLLRATIAAPSGILLHGPAGVGKTTLVESAVSPSSRHFVSVHDLVLQTSWGTEENLLAALQVPNGKSVLILDDLDALSEISSTDDHERRIVSNAIGQAIDAMVERRIAVLGIVHTPSHLPPELRKVGRLEKCVEMLPPSQLQRECILDSMLNNATWAELLASMTAGFVAADLRRICGQAWNRALAREQTEFTWPDLVEATRICVPSQLASLDVTKPQNFLDVCGRTDWRTIHDLSWERISGYAPIKKRIFRSVVGPWRRILNEETDKQVASIPAPSGVLFHGPSGCGKTLAASCLGSSLSLPMVKVRTSDVLDKWLGGSESAVRSLFSRARAAAPCILFFDEIDAIASNRATAEESSDVLSRVLSTFLNEMDGVSNKGTGDILVVACTNRLETLDAALLRPGRLGEHVLFGKPQILDTKAILKSTLERAPLHEHLDVDKIALHLVNCSATGADIEGVCREAVFQALRRSSKENSEIFVSHADMEQALAALNL